MSEQLIIGESGLDEGWHLIGEDGRDRKINLLIGEAQLSRAHLGLTLGRHAALCDLVIDDPTVSRRHLRIGRTGDGLYIEDVNSLNGTLLDGAWLLPFEPVNLEEGAELSLGNVVLRVTRDPDSLDTDKEDKLQ